MDEGKGQHGSVTTNPCGEETRPGHIVSLCHAPNHVRPSIPFLLRPPLCSAAHLPGRSWQELLLLLLLLSLGLDSLVPGILVAATCGTL
jgi:hypothetical protein